jgi:hypothetical protein
MSYRETEHLRVHIANERKDRLTLVAPIVAALGSRSDRARDTGGFVSAGITSYDRRVAANSGRFSRGICAGKEASGRYVKSYPDLQGFYGSDGTRTRDLRRDRPAF